MADGQSMDHNNEELDRKIQRIHEIRKRIHDIMIDIARESSMHDSRHFEQLAIDRLTEGRMWLGILLGNLGEKLPEEFRDE